MLGKARCKECGGVKTLVVKGSGFWSKCLKCGMEEWEWEHGDNPEYLRELAEEYGVSVQQLWDALKGGVRLPTDIQKTIVAQLEHLNPKWRIQYGVTGVFAHRDGRTVEIRMRYNGKSISTTITYDTGLDLYRVKAERLKLRWETSEKLNVRMPYIEREPLYEREGVFWDELDEALRLILKAAEET